MEKLVTHLRAALNILEAQLDPPEVPQEVQEMVAYKIANRICLAWDHKIPEGERVTRGQCTVDYPTTMARVRRGDDDERELIKQGKLTAERQKPGRKSKRDTISPDEAKRVAEDMERYEARKRERKTKPGK